MDEPQEQIEPQVEELKESTESENQPASTDANITEDAVPSESKRVSKTELRTSSTEQPKNPETRGSLGSRSSITGKASTNALRTSSKDALDSAGSEDTTSPENNIDAQASSQSDGLNELGERKSKPGSAANKLAQATANPENSGVAAGGMTIAELEMEKEKNELHEKDLPSYEFLYGKYQYTPMKKMLPEESDVALAKTFLMTNSQKVDTNLYDHLTSVVMRVLETRPQNAYDIFETISAETKRQLFKSQKTGLVTTFRQETDHSEIAQVAKTHMGLFEHGDESGAELQKENLEGIPDILDHSTLWEWAGITLGTQENFLLLLSIKKLSQEKPLRTIRVWGKLLGRFSNYIVIEGELREGLPDEDDAIANGTLEPEAVEEAEAEKVEEVEEPKEEEGVEKPVVAPIPKPKAKVNSKYNKEVRSGVNKFVYYVCSHPGAPWVRLPDVDPEKLQASRKIRKYLTGDLTHKINSYPAFEGTEAQYLRCQIARISSATVVSPAGYYIFDPEEGEGDESEPRTTIITNPEFEGLSNEDMLQLSNWVHHVPYILPQGRVIWEDPYAHVRKNKDEEEEEENENEENEGDENEGNGIPELTEPEQGPPILSPLNGDEDHGDIPSWSARLCSSLSPTKYSPVVIRSNRWPGATVVGYNDKFTNIYVGDGLKDLGNPVQQFVTPKLPEIQKEYASGVEGALGSPEDLLEQIDPTVEDEAAYEAALKAKEEEAKEGEEEAEETEEGEGEEED